MRTIVLTALLPLAACGNFGGDDDQPGVQGSGSGGSRTYQVADFTAVDLAGSDNVEVRVGPGFAVRAEGDSAVLDRLKITREGDSLRVSRRNGTSSGRAQVFVTMPSIRGASISGSGNLLIDRVRAEAFKADIAGSGNLAIGQLATRQAAWTIEGSGDLSAAGTAGRLEIDIAGSGNVDAPRLTTSAAKVNVAGSGNVQTIVKGAAEVTIMGSGDVDLGPDARCSVQKMGSGTVRCGG